MFKIKLIILTSFICLSFSAFSQQKEVVYIRIQENINALSIGSTNSYMNVIYPDQTTKYTELAKVGPDGVGADENGKKIQSEITYLLNDGYEITSGSVGSDSSYSTTVLILTREKKTAR